MKPTYEAQTFFPLKLEYGILEKLRSWKKVGREGGDIERLELWRLIRLFWHLIRISMEEVTCIS